MTDFTSELREAVATVNRWRGLYKFSRELSDEDMECLKYLGIVAERVESPIGRYCYNLSVGSDGGELPAAGVT